MTPASRAPFNRDVWAVFGMPIDNVTVAEAAAQIEAAVETRERLSFVTPNVNWLVRALKDPATMRQIVDADLSLADGAPIVWLARRLGMPIKERVAGSDLFNHLRYDTSADAKPIRVYFFGGREGAAEAAYLALERENGRLQPAGWHNPGFGDVASMSAPEICAKINAARPDFVLVSLGAAKGQAWIERNLDTLEAPILAHLGAVVDFVAGTIKRAPRWVSRLGLEWIWRIIEEPSLWKRYWNDGTALLALARTRLPVLQRAAKTDQRDELVVETEGKRVALTGNASLAHRDQLRSTFVSACDQSSDIDLDLNGATALDAAAMGQIRMLEKDLRTRGHTLRVEAGQNLSLALKAAGFEAQAA
ncbi:MAG: WecB/TagA/CpsF family glycosyltransferase [Henriciella sp.]|nr:WecB/TagA/CpsF family glycosyltransferase [Henriciella sp.]